MSEAQRKGEKSQPSLSVDRRIAGLPPRDSLALHVERGSDRGLRASALAFAFVFFGVH